VRNPSGRDSSSSGDSLLRKIVQAIQESLVRSPALGAVAVMGALAVVELQILIQVLLQLLDAFVDGLAESDGEELFLDSAMEAFAESVGFGRVDAGPSVADLVNGQEQLEGMVQFAAAELAAIVCEQVIDVDLVFFVERKNPLMKNGNGSERFFGESQFGDRIRRAARDRRCESGVFESGAVAVR
jgi:hypothetical protein